MTRRIRGRGQGPGRSMVWGALVAMSLLGTAGGFLAAPYLLPAPAPSSDVAASAEPETPATTLLPTLDQPLTVLFMATDVNYTVKDGKRVAGLRGNTDTMMLARFDPTHGDARVLSIPRDTRTAIPGHGTFKINAAVPYGGSALAVQTVSELLGVPVERFVLINTRAVVQLVDALGGVEVFVPADLKYDDWTGKLHIHLKKGPNKLNGQQAHDFLRFRHDGQGDIGRVQRQQLFMQAAVRQLLTPGNLLRVPALVGLVRENLETDLSVSEMARLGSWGSGLDGSKVRLAMLPGHEAMIRGGWYWELEPEATKRMVEGFLLAQGNLPPREPGRVRVAIRDGVGDRRGIARLRKALGTAGYVQVENAGLDAERGRRTTLVIANDADEAGAQELAAAIGVGEVVVAATGALGSHVTVVMGQDWLDRTPEPQPAVP